MASEVSTVRAKSWRDLFPWLLLGRVFRLSIGVLPLALATVGVLLIPAGWWACEHVFLSPEDRPSKDHRRDSPLAQEVAELSHWQDETMIGAAHLTRATEASGITMLGLHAPANLVQPFRLFADPTGEEIPRLNADGTKVDSSSRNFRARVYLLAGFLWVLSVWSFFGAAITRIAAVRLAADQPVSLREALGHATRKSLAYFTAPASLLAVTLALGLPCLVAGWLLNLNVFVPLAGLGWFVLLFCGFLMTVCLVALAVGWPIMWGTIGTECSDAFDAVSRTLSYIYQKPLHYLFYALVAAFLGGLGELVVEFFAWGTINASYAAAAWGCGSERIEEIRLLIAGRREESSYWLWTGAGIISLWTGLVATIAKAYAYSFMWSACAGIYLLLRKDVDDKELDEVFLDDEPDLSSAASLAVPSTVPPKSPGSSSPATSVPPQPE